MSLVAVTQALPDTAFRTRHDESAVLLAPLVRSQINAVMADLERLESIVDDAAATLLTSFGDLQGSITALDPNWMHSPTFVAVGRAITAMQFHDLAIQLVGGVKAQLRIASASLDQENAFKTSPEMPLSTVDGVAHIFAKQPVQQENIDSGSIDLF
jgi:hypothetical protein